MINKKNNDLQSLITLYLENKISREEFEQLLQTVDTVGHEETLRLILKDEWEKVKERKYERKVDLDVKFQQMMDELKHDAPVVQMPARNRRPLLYYIAAAVIITFVLGTVGYLLFKNNDKQQLAVNPVKEAKPQKQELLPGTQGAILTLANGKQIVLDSAGNGTVAMQGTTSIINKDGLIVYDDEKGTPDSLLYNTITTPKGRQYQIALADGSKVWLNAASSIRYPAAFTGKERTVEITGEAYFEVAHNAEKPFKVLVNDMEVRVLGTHFNVNSYEDEATVQTTLLEGSVKVSKNNASKILSPGQQAQVNNDLSRDRSIKVLKDIDLDAVIAWKNGYFSFGQTDLGTLMRQIGRWYDVEIVYAGAIPRRRFGGEISRNTSLSQVLKALEESKVHFRIEGKKVIVQP